MQNNYQKLIKIAVITGAHGIKGEVKLRLLIENQDFFSHTTNISDSSGTKFFKIVTTGRIKDQFIARIEGINSRNEAEMLRNTELFAKEADFPELEDDEFYHNQLIGLEARLESGETIGKVAAIYNYGAGDIVEITKVSGESEMLPLSPPWLGKVDIKQGFITITLPEYL